MPTPGLPISKSTRAGVSSPSRRRDEEFPLAVGRKGEAGINVLPGKLRKIL
jgi:hypothetical protein